MAIGTRDYTVLAAVCEDIIWYGKYQQSALPREYVSLWIRRCELRREPMSSWILHLSLYHFVWEILVSVLLLAFLIWWLFGLLIKKYILLEGARGFARLLGVNSKKTTKHVFNKIFLTVWIYFFIKIGGNLKSFSYKLSTPYLNP